MPTTQNVPMLGKQTENYWGNGQNASIGKQNIEFYYQMASIKAASAKLVFSKFAESRLMPQKMGKEYRISVYHNIYDRLPYSDATWNDINKKDFSADFAKYGYLSSRDIADVTNAIYGGDGKGYTAGTYADNGKRLLEGEGAANKLTIKRSTFSAKIERFGEMIEYTNDALLFTDGNIRMMYSQQLGEAAAQLYEDLLQLDLLSTPNVMYAGTAISKATMGQGIGEGTPDAVTKRNAVEDSYRINYNLIQKMVDKLFRNRAPVPKTMLTGSTKIGTTPIGSSYIALVGPEVAIDLQNIVRGDLYERHFAFTPVEQYASQGDIIDGEIGRVNNMRFVRVERILREAGAGADVDPAYVGNLSYTEKTDTTNNTTTKKFDLFPILIPCRGAFATIGLMGVDKIQFTQKAPGNIDSLDPYGQIGFFTYQFWYGSIILHPEWLLKTYVLASS